MALGTLQAGVVGSAWPNGEANAESQYRLLYPGGPTASHVFTVNHVPLILKALSIGVGETVSVEVVEGIDVGSIYDDYAPNGESLTLTASERMLVLPIPGRYRVSCPTAGVSLLTVMSQELSALSLPLVECLTRF